MPRWWGGDTAWLDRLPATVAVRCADWNLELDGNVLHGSNAIVVPVRRAGIPFVLRMCVPGDEFAQEVSALEFWAGRGTVRIFDSNAPDGSMLLERLDLGGTLADVPLHEAVPVIGRLLRRLAIPVALDTRGILSTGEVVATRAIELEAEWEHLGQPFGRKLLDQALFIAGLLAAPRTDFAVNGDIHFDQVLRGRREPWLAVDPVLLRGEVDYDLARVLWSRLDEMPTNSSVLGHFDTLVREAHLDAQRAWFWVFFRTIDYWLWGLTNGLTTDPERCRRLASIFTEPARSSGAS
ncbi:MAG: aminoglycoside phosphotransferase family protein [Cryobacterium sp.]|nr:aminoglycoside phosphotransferase family protein [Cryobacterium sp.]